MLVNINITPMEKHLYKKKHKNLLARKKYYTSCTYRVWDADVGFYTVHSFHGFSEEVEVSIRESIRARSIKSSPRIIAGSLRQTTVQIAGKRQGCCYNCAIIQRSHRAFSCVSTSYKTRIYLINLFLVVGNLIQLLETYELRDLSNCISINKQATAIDDCNLSLKINDQWLYFFDSK